MLLDGAPDVLAALLLATALDRLVGDPDWLYRRVPHPVVLLGRLVTLLEAGLLRPKAAPLVQRLVGVLLMGGVVAAAALTGLALTSVARALPLGWLVEAVLMSTLLAWRSLADHVAAVASGLKESLAEGRAAVARIVGRDPEGLDEHAVARAATESLAENLSDGVIAPLLWGAFLGLPGMLAYKAINTLDSMVGYRNERYRHFGWASARLDDLVNLLPARLTALSLLIAASVTRGAQPGEAWRALWRDAPRHRSPNAGWPEAAMAGALGLKLAGPRRYGGRVVEDAWMGRGRAEATADDIRSALLLGGRAYAIVVALLVLVWLADLSPS
jgi:adenosylcobinamide-phosphate synthase